jgi:hypothetical protein
MAYVVRISCPTNTAKTYLDVDANFGVEAWPTVTTDKEGMEYRVATWIVPGTTKGEDQ